MDFIEKLPVGGYNPSSSFLVLPIFSSVVWLEMKYNTN